MAQKTTTLGTRLRDILKLQIGNISETIEREGRRSSAAATTSSLMRR